MAKENTRKKKASDLKERSSSARDWEAETKHAAWNEHLLAFFMIVMGIFLSLSLTTPAMGIVGQGVSYLSGALIGHLGILASIVLFGLGTARFLFSQKMPFEKISKGMVVSLIILSFLLYGWMYMSTVLEQDISFQEIQKTWVYSAAGDGMGILPYLFTLLLTKLIGKAGMVLVTVALLIFILFHYFHLSSLWHQAEEHKTTAEGEYVQGHTMRSGGWWSRLRTWVEDFIFETDLEEDTGSLSTDFSENKPSGRSVLWTMDKKEKEDNGSSPSLGNSGKISFEDSKEQRKIPTYEEFCEGDLLDGYSFQENETSGKDDFSLVETDMGKEEGSLEAKSSEKPYIYEDLEELKREGKARREKNREEAGMGSQDGSTKDEMHSQDEETAKEYVLPPVWLLKEKKQQKRDMTERNKQARLLEETLGIFGIEATVTNIAVGPSITRYELQPKAGTKVSKIVNLSDDLSLALASQSIRIEAPIPGKSLVGIEVANKVSEMVDFRSVIETQPFREAKSLVSFALGKDVTGEIIVADLAAMPHLLVAGSTGSGKSVCINTIICSILCRARPDQVKFIMIDPKMVELANYNDIPHLLIPVVTDMKKAPYALNWAVGEMNRRYKLFSENRVKDIFGYNEKFPEDPLSNIVIIVDELADLMLVSPKDVEDAICRIAQMARACGMHLVIATQRPSVDVITGLIKANIPSRIAFAVSSQTDSRTILDMGGAEKLLGKGDSLYYPIGMNKPKRVQGAFISEKEVQNIVAFIKEQSGEMEMGPDIIQEARDKEEEERDKFEEDPLLKEVIKFAVDQGKVSTSLVQRRFRIGYNRASRMVEELEHKGIIGPSNGVRPREVLIDSVEEEDDVMS